MIEAGRIVARLCRVYGWTPDYCLDRLSWAQVLMFDAYARAPRGVTAPETGVSPPSEGEDGPDVEQIEQQYGPRIRRGIDGR